MPDHHAGPGQPMPSTSEPPFSARVESLPWLGLGISTEFGAQRNGLDPLALARAHPEFLRFLEIGADLERGVDDTARAWVANGAPVTYHFLDVNLEEPEDLDAEWVAGTVRLARSLGAAWLCGDAGLWHVGPRDRGHGTLMPPILEPDSADSMALAVRRLRAESGFEVLPENPPAHVYAGRMHLCEYFARVAEKADCGLLLDVAHLAIHQHVTGRATLDGVDALPWERVVELHVAGATPFQHAGRTFFDDSHAPQPLPATWELLEHALERARNLRAVVYECERNRPGEVLPVYARLAALLEAR